MHDDHERNRFERVETQVNRVRELYSRIGEPLPADAIIDLYRHLAPALEAVEPKRKDRPRTQHRLDA